MLKQIQRRDSTGAPSNFSSSIGASCETDPAPNVRSTSPSWALSTAASTASTNDPAEILQRFLNLSDGNIQSHSDGNRCGCVQNIMHAGYVQAKFAEVLVAKCYRKQTDLWGHRRPRPCKSRNSSSG